MQLGTSMQLHGIVAIVRQGLSGTPSPKLCPGHCGADAARARQGCCVARCSRRLVAILSGRGGANQTSTNTARCTTHGCMALCVRGTQQVVPQGSVIGMPGLVWRSAGLCSALGSSHGIGNLVSPMVSVAAGSVIACALATIGRSSSYACVPTRQCGIGRRSPLSKFHGERRGAAGQSRRAARPVSSVPHRFGISGQVALAT